MDKIESFWPIKKDSFIKWHFKQAIDSFIFIIHMAKQIHFDEGTAHLSKRFVYDMIKSFYVLIYSPPPPPPANLNVFLKANYQIRRAVRNRSNCTVLQQAPSTGRLLLLQMCHSL